jgi:hypothetical protein
MKIEHTTKELAIIELFQGKNLTGQAADNYRKLIKLIDKNAIERSKRQNGYYHSEEKMNNLKNC